MTNYDKTDATTEPMQVEEIVFTGGTIRDGKIFADPGFRVDLAPDGSKVVFKNDNGKGVTITCICAKENAPEGSCVLVEMDPDDSDNPIRRTLFCNPAGCGTEIGGALCWSELSALSGDFSILLKFARQ